MIPLQRASAAASLPVLVVDGCLAGCIFVVPFFLGGQHPAGRLLLVALAATAAVAWAIHQTQNATAQNATARNATTKWRWSGAEFILLAGLALVCLQLAPMEQATLERLSPHTLEILPLYRAGSESPGPLGVWSTISLAPPATRSALVMFLAYGLLFGVAVARIGSRDDVERLLRWIALSATLTAAFALVQYFTTNGKYFWLYERPFAHTFKAPKAAFGNRNHFAHFLALAIGPLVWWLQDGLRRRAKSRRDAFTLGRTGQDALAMATALRVLALAVVAFALLLSLSRGGIAVAALAGLVAVAACYQAKSAGLRFVATLGAIGLLVAAGVAIFGHDRISDRLDSLRAVSTGALDQADARRTIWKATYRAAGDYKLLGSGVGSFREVAPMYLETTDNPTYFGHAECGYLQIALEAGLLGLGLTLAGIAFCGFWCAAGLAAAESKATLACTGAVAAGLTASAVHSLGDFVWYNPACMTVAVILAACACRLWQMRPKKRIEGDQDAGTSAAAKHYESPNRQSLIPNPQSRSCVAAVVLALLGAWMIRQGLGPAMAEEHLVRFELLRQAAEEFARTNDASDADAAAEPTAQTALAAEERLKAELERAVQRSPDDARTHFELAACYLRLFDLHQQDAVNVMSLGQIRDAAIASHFPSRAALDAWLARAVGEHHTYLDAALTHTRRALALCPLLGEGYLYLADLCFLENADASTHAAYLAQATAVRPFDGAVHFHVGKEAWLAGDYDKGIEQWQRAFRCGEVYQRQMIDWLAGKIRPEHLDEEIEFFLKIFQPDLTALAYLDERYHTIAQPEEMVALRTAYGEALAQRAETADDAEAAELWLTAVSVYGALDDGAQAIACARKAVDCQPGNYTAHWTLARRLATAGQYRDAECELVWCLQRRPGDKRLTAMHKDAIAKRIDAESGSRMAEHGKGRRL